MRRHLASVAIKEIEIKARPYLRVRLQNTRMNGRARGRRRRGR